MLRIIPVCVVLGIAWNILAVCLMGGRVRDAFATGWLLAGAIAGIAAGLFTVWSRRRSDGTESFLSS